MFDRKNELLKSNFDSIIMQLKKYKMLTLFSTEKDLYKWISELSSLEIHNFLNLSIEPEFIKFDLKLLLDKNLLNTLDYNKRVEALVSINNAEGWYHLFNKMLNLEFLKSTKFYQDIETLKRAVCAQTPLWIIGDPVFINSPYHDEDFELLVTAKDTCQEGLDFVVWEAIATVAKNFASIESGYHRQDLKTIIKYGSKSLQLSSSFPEHSIHCLATHPVSLNDKYHLENMDILAQNQEIGNFLYAVMTNPNVIKNKNYRTIINEMVENKDNMSYVFLVCFYAIGETAVSVQNRLLHQHFFEDIVSSYNLKELLQQVDDRIFMKSKNVIDGNFRDIRNYEIEYNAHENESELDNKKQKIIRKFLKRKKDYL